MDLLCVERYHLQRTAGDDDGAQPDSDARNRRPLRLWVFALPRPGGQCAELGLATHPAPTMLDQPRT